MQHRPGRDSRRRKTHQSGKPPCVATPHTVGPDWSVFNPETTLGHITVCLTQSKNLATAPNHFLELLAPSMAVSAVLAALRLHSLVLRVDLVVQAKHSLLTQVSPWSPPVSWR